ncbi:MAG: DUF502 domain-containing protein [Planctomycetes bacterium]|nr:DUF502 domain-containing protein [Planctomycetota bacterium]
MASFRRHLARTLVAGVVALLPVGGLVLAVAWTESLIAGSGLGKQSWYVPGAGLLVVVAVTYAIGLFVTTFVGRGLWQLVDALLSELPLVGGLYHTLQQILGYGEGKGAMFERVVWLASRDLPAEELALVTRTLPAEDGEVERLVLFLPSAVNPTVGRLLVVEGARTRPADLTVNAALKALVSLGKAGLHPDDEADETSRVVSLRARLAQRRTRGAS